jgi:uncharacterized membrane protein
MIIRFEEQFEMPVEEIYRYFKTPMDWPRLYGAFGEVKDRGGGWVAVPLRGFPFPLVAKTTHDEPLRRVCWIFRGFWRGTGEVRFRERPGGVIVEGFEEIAIRPLGFLSPIVESLMLERRFRGIWEHGWRRLRKGEPAKRG